LKKLITRAITGIVLVVIMLTSVLVSEYCYAILFLFILFGGLHEFINLFQSKDAQPNKYLSFLVSIALFAVSFLVAAKIIEYKYLTIIIPLFLLILSAELYRKKEKPVDDIAVTIFSVIYVAVPLSIINFLVFPNIGETNKYNPTLLIALFALIWIYDTGAYLVGITIGRHRLFERISPKKSWEGAAGGTVFAVLTAYFISRLIPEISETHWIIISFLVVISGTFGDLAESMFKRYFGIKDSSNLLPGHGGILDRFDSLFFVAPVIVVYLKLFIEQ
jgi:phosphatidate cytidylyltransferase